jgi:hypothetical protein
VKCVLAFLDFRTQAVRQLRDDVVLLGARQVAADGGEIAIDEIHMRS